MAASTRSTRARRALFAEPSAKRAKTTTKHMIAKTVRAMAETKNVTNEGTFLSSNTALLRSSATALTAITQGVDEKERIGNKIQVRV